MKAGPRELALRALREGRVTKSPAPKPAPKANNVTREKAGRPRLHASAAEKQRAYRRRKAESGQ